MHQLPVRQRAILSPGGMSVVSLLARPPTADALAPAVQSTPPAHGAPSSHGTLNAIVYDWAARIHAKKFELGHGYAVLGSDPFQ